MLQRFAVMACAIAAFFSLSVFACSNIFVTGPGVAAVGRTMDLELNTGEVFGFGVRGEKNVSNINYPQNSPIHAMHWINRYAFLGQSAFKTYVLVDGLNTQGLYAAFLDLPNISVYPTYDPKDTRPELGLTDTVNYVLGTSNSVPNAIENLKKAQIIKNAFVVTVGRTTLFGGNAVHLVLRDKLGNNATIEWTKTKGQSRMHIYLHQAGETQVVEETPSLSQKMIFRNAKGMAVTNSPAYHWQLQNASRYNYMFTGSTKRQWDGQYMNGSGMYRIPGSWTPPARFARGTQLVRLMPTPKTEAQALTLAWNALETMKVPAGANPAMSIWATLSDLKNSVYYYKVLLSPYPNFSKHLIQIALPAFNSVWQSYDLKHYAKDNVVPKGWVSAKVAQGKIATPAGVKQDNQMIHAPTPGGVKTTIAFR